MKKIISALLILVMMLSMICVSSSAAVYLNADFSTWSEDQFYTQFMVGEFHVDDAEKVLYGYSDAKALQSMYSDPEGFFDNTLNTWLTYDASITFSMADDDLSELDRSVSISYCNDNLMMRQLAGGRQFITFEYNIDEGVFKATTSVDEVDIELGQPVARDLDTDGGTYYTMGISVQKNRFRCFFDNELIYDIDCSAYYVGDQYNSPFFFWNNGNYLCIKNISVGSEGSIYPVSAAPAVTTAPATTRVEQVTVTNEKGEAVTNEKGEAVTDTVIITDAPADTNTGAVVGGNATATGDSAFIVVAVMVAAIGCALIVRKANVR